MAYSISFPFHSQFRKVNSVESLKVPKRFISSYSCLKICFEQNELKPLKKIFSLHKMDTNMSQCIPPWFFPPSHKQETVKAAIIEEQKRSEKAVEEAVKRTRDELIEYIKEQKRVSTSWSVLICASINKHWLPYNNMKFKNI